MLRNNKGFFNLGIHVVFIGVLITLAVLALVLLVKDNKINNLNKDVVNAVEHVDGCIETKVVLVSDILNILDNYMPDEDVMIIVKNAKTNLENAKTIKEKDKTISEMAVVLDMLFLVTKNYPELSGDIGFNYMVGRLAVVDNDIKVEKRNYNDTANRFNWEINRTSSRFLLSCKEKDLFIE